MNKAGFTQDYLRDEELRSLLESVPVLQDKMIVDLVNGLEVAQEHIRLREGGSQDVFTRAWDALTGRAARRQQNIDQNLTKGLYTASIWLENLQAGQIQTDRALAYVSGKLAETRNGVHKLVLKHLELKQTVEDLEERLQEMERQYQKRTSELQKELQSIGLRQSALIHMNKEFDKWEGGGYKQFAPLTQMLLVIEALNWGPFGIYDAANPEFREQLYYKCAIVLENKAGIPEKLMPTVNWILPMLQEKETHKQMFSYLLQSESEQGTLQSTILRSLAWKQGDADASEFIQTELDCTEQAIPFVFSSRRLSERLLKESRGRLEREGMHVSGF